MTGEPEAPAEAQQKGGREGRFRRAAGFLTIGVGLTGLITYVYFFIAAHNLDRDSYGEITVLWSAVFITVSTLYRPVDQLLSRSIAEHMERGESTAGPVKVAARIQLFLGIGFAILTLILKGPIEDGLLDGNAVLYWIFFFAVLFYAASYYARGYFAGHQQFGLFTTLILSESVFRTLFAVLVAIGILSGQNMVAMGIVAAPLLSLMVVPFAINRRTRREEAGQRADSEPDADPDAAKAEFKLSTGAGFVGSVFLIMLSEQVFLNAGPLLVNAIGGAAAAGYIFNVLMIARAPLQLFQAVSTSILPHLTSLHHSGEPDSEAEFHSTINTVFKGILAFTALTALVVLVAGPELMQLAFSDKFFYDRADLLLVTAGMGFYLAAVTFNQAAVAQGQARRASIRWIVCAVFFITWTLLPLIQNINLRVEIGFTLTALILMSSIFYIYRRPSGPEDGLPLEGTPDEISARLAGLEEGAP